MRTRPGLKSCLKITPPITPDFSAASSPCGSGRTSPSLASDGGSSTGSAGGGRKSVQFCPANELEEVFFADEWDRTPAAVTPKLSYQDILELKQLRISLPYSPPPPTSRQPFTTSAPAPSSSSSSASASSSKPPFPVSRFATGPSHTPSKWKNRCEPKRDVDPEILPYLDAVPIRLLPLLPQSPPSDSPPTDAPEPHPQTPTPTASPERRPAPPPPIEPPEIKIAPPAPAPAPSPIPPAPAPAPAPPPSSPPSRRQNFAFVPLLPVQDPPPILPPPASNTNGPVRPKKTFNMTFLPVNAVPESQPLAPPHTTSARLTEHTLAVGTATMTSAPLPQSSSSVSGCDPRSTDASQLLPRPPSPPTLSSTLTPTPNMSQPPPFDLSPPPLTLSLPLSSSSVAMESDNETETDTTDTYVSDTDVESDAPSTSTLGSSLPSPPLEDDSDVDVEARLEQIKLGTSEGEDTFDQATYVSRERIRTQDPGSYFPPVPLSEAPSAPMPIPIPAYIESVDAPPALPSGPGQTPPLSVLYPSPTSQHQPLLPLDAISSIPASTSASAPVPSSHPQPPSIHAVTAAASEATEELSAAVASLAREQGLDLDDLPATPLSLRQVLQKKLTLEALPSPALVPPSPFELEPSDAAALAAAAATSSAGLEDVSAAEVAQKLAALNLAVGPEDTPLVRTSSRLKGSSMNADDTPDDSPLLTLENMRAAWDAGAGVGMEVAAKGGLGALAPSLSRRRSS
ncbi:hypothetical protein PYCCODRAFT_1432451 [Trametes coccinea BRFM310]|uniref:Uncharacterized protein n=1 Tax=Trametes coccinea (strain BRFM310) TaxID=1353009 RepID=A0A1Y2IZ96_TRAC3|nr:hypothetical protein PYCCODRAFT_1432451 [Trametes coccinea BRFM310]